MTDWYNDPDNITTLLRYLADQGATAHEVVAAQEKPWNYEDEFIAARNEMEGQQTSTA